MQSRNWKSPSRNYLLDGLILATERPRERKARRLPPSAGPEGQGIRRDTRCTWPGATTSKRWTDRSTALAGLGSIEGITDLVDQFLRPGGLALPIAVILTSSRTFCFSIQLDQLNKMIPVHSKSPIAELLFLQPRGQQEPIDRLRTSDKLRSLSSVTTCDRGPCTASTTL